MLHPEHPAPRLPDDRVPVVYSEMTRQVDQLVLEQLNRPEVRRRVGEVRRVPAADLVVQHAAAPVPRELRDRLAVVVRSARAAVADHDGRGAGGEVADDAVPRLVPVTGQRSLAHVPAPFASSGWWQAAKLPPP